MKKEPRNPPTAELSGDKEFDANWKKAMKHIKVPKKEPKKKQGQ